MAKKKRFIFDENYIKRYAKKNQFRLLIIGGSVLILILIIIIVMIANRKPKKKPVRNVPVYEIKESLTLEAGSALPEVQDYFNKLENIDPNSIKITYPEEFEITYNTSKCNEEELASIGTHDKDMTEFSCVIETLTTPTTYGVTVTVDKKEHTVNLTVEDKTAPVVVAKELEISKGTLYTVKDFASICYDISGECNLVFFEEKDANDKIIDYANYKEIGEYEIKIIANDKYGNKTEVITTKLIIKKPDISTYTVTFNSDGGSEVASIFVNENDRVTEPAAPTKAGYRFVGWYDGDNKFDFNTAITRDITLIAKWQKNGASGATSISLNFKAIYLEVGEAKTVTASVYPGTANKNVTWASEDASIATVDNGKITGVKIGTVRITATANGKTASVTVNVRAVGSGSCGYGDASYNTGKYVLSAMLASGNCAVDPNRPYNETVSQSDYQKLIRDLSNMGFNLSPSTFTYKSSYVSIKNNAGTGLVGYQITIYASVIENGKLLNAEYIIKPDGSRQMINNNITKNGVQFR